MLFFFLIFFLLHFTPALISTPSCVKYSFFLFSLLFPLVICFICIKVVAVVLCVQLHSKLGIWSLGSGLLFSSLARPKSQPSWKLSLPVLTFQGLRFKDILGFTDKWNTRRTFLDNEHEITLASTLLIQNNKPDWTRVKLLRGSSQLKNWIDPGP